MNILTLPEHVAWTEHLQYIDLETGIKMAYLEAGNPKKETLLLLHGFSDSSRGWRSVMENLLEEYHIYAVDLRGHGRTDAPEVPVYTMMQHAEDIHAFINQMKLTPVFLVGHSMGSYIAHTIASVHPEDVSKICLAATMAHMHETEDDFAEIRDIIEHFGDNCKSDEYMELWLGESRNFKDVDYFTYYKKTVREMKSHVFPAAWYGMSIADHRNLMRYITASTMILWGEEDELFTEEFQVEIKEIIPTIEVFISYPGCSHEIPQERPKELAEAIKDFFRN